jgi:type IV pilus biogenesis/stability protein PilW
VIRPGIGHLILIVILSACIGCATDHGVSKKKRVKALEEMGVAYLREGNRRGALEKFLEAAQMDPENAEIQHQLALVYRDLGQYRFAVEHFRKALALRPKFPEAMNNLGTVYLILKQWDDAIAAFEGAAEELTYKTPHIAYNNLGLAHQGRGDYQRAIASFRLALRHSPSYAVCARNLGLVYEELQDWEAALEAYEQAVEMEPMYAAAHFNLGKLYLRFNRDADAVAALKKAIEPNPRSAVAQEAKKILRTIQIRQ